MDIADIRYPIGKFLPVPYSESQKIVWINELKVLPQALEIAVANLDEEQLLTSYRPGGWNLIQVVHHVADSHMNAYVRTKLTLTEQNPVIKPYQEALWAELQDTKDTAMQVSITLLHCLHIRWVSIWESLSENDFNKNMIHPDNNKSISLWDQLGTYAWHGRHHTAHITCLREKMHW